MWMGEGFMLQISHEEDSADTIGYKGEQYLRELMQRCMVQVREISKLGRIKTCRIHEPSHNLMLGKLLRGIGTKRTSIFSLLQDGRCVFL